MDAGQTRWMPGSWEIVRDALARRKNPAERTQAWLAKRLDVTAQAVTNWKKEGVPDQQLDPLRGILGLTYAQLKGEEPLPWERQDGAWPFPDIDPARFFNLTEKQQGEIQGKVRETIEAFEARSGKSTPSSHGAGHRKTGT